MKARDVASAIVLALGTFLHGGRNSLAAEGAGAISGDRPKSVAVVISKEAGGLEQFAAAESSRYLQRLFGVSVRAATAPDEGPAAQTRADRLRPQPRDRGLAGLAAH